MYELQVCEHRNVYIEETERERERPTKQHVPVSLVGDGVDVRRHLVPFLALVHVDHLLCVDWQPFVGVDHHTEQARVGLSVCVCIEQKERKKFKKIRPISSKILTS